MAKRKKRYTGPYVPPGDPRAYKSGVIKDMLLKKGYKVVTVPCQSEECPVFFYDEITMDIPSWLEKYIEQGKKRGRNSD